jgi:hypothetical protein
MCKENFVTPHWLEFPYQLKRRVAVSKFIFANTTKIELMPVLLVLLKPEIFKESLYHHKKHQ